MLGWRDNCHFHTRAHVLKTTRSESEKAAEHEGTHELLQLRKSRPIEQHYANHHWSNRLSRTEGLWNIVLVIVVGVYYNEHRSGW
jgi:hypothetical protein